MARNTFEWFKWEPRRWHESERRSRMPLAAQAVYVLALGYQSTHGSIPSDTAELARRLDLCEPFDQWESVFQHFDSEDVNGEMRLFHPDLRKQLIERDRISEAKANNRKNKTKTDDKQKKNGRKSNALPRASKSISLSSSVSNDDSNSTLGAQERDFGFEAFWSAYPRKDDKQKAKATWLKLKPAPELVERIVAHIEMMKVSKNWLEDQGKYIPLPTTYLNNARWEDRGIQGLPKAPAAGRKQSHYIDNPAISTERGLPLTPEEQAAADLERAALGF